MPDVNDTRYHLLSGARDFRPILAEQGAGERLWFDDELGALSLRPELFRFPPRPGEAALTPAERRGAAADRYGNWYWIGPDEDEIRFRPPSADLAGSFWRTADLFAGCRPEPQRPGEFTPSEPPPPPVLPRLRGLAVTGHHYLVVGTVDPGGLLVFDLHAGGPPVGWLRWGEVAFAPFDLAPALDHGLWVLDLGASDGLARVWRLDRYFRVVCEMDGVPSPPPLFAPLDSPACEPLGGFAASVLSAALATPADVAEAVAIEGLPDGSVLVLESSSATSFSVVHRFQGGLPAGSVSLDEALSGLLAEDAEALGGDVKGHDLAFLAAADSEPGWVSGELFVAGVGGNQSFAFALSAGEDLLAIEPLPSYLPMRRYGGKGLVASGCGVYYDLAERWLPLAEQPRRRYPTRATLAGLVLDGKEAGCVWHRLALDGCLPDGTALSVWIRAADEESELADTEWGDPEPSLYRRAEGSEQPFQRPFTDEERQSGGVGTWELLFQDAVGRYAELRLGFESRGLRTPRVRALRVHYPRFSYADRYLPAVYGDNEISASFLERFLANPEGLLTTLEGRIERAQILLDPRTAPEEYLDWLACWLGASLDDNWDESRRRLFIAHAEELFRWRGTPSGLAVLIRLATDPCPDESLFELLGVGTLEPVAGFGGFTVRIVERFQLRAAPGVALGDPSRLEQPGFTTIAQPGGSACRLPASGAAGGGAWDPSQGAAPLHELFREFLRAAYGSPDATNAAVRAAVEAAWERSYPSFAAIELFPVLPAHPVAAEDWSAFISTGLGFTYAAVIPEDEPHYQAFLARRYGRLAALNQAHGLLGVRRWSSLDAVTLPAEDDFPESGGRLVDWIDFVSLYLPIRRNAHKMSVLVPVEAGETEAARDLRLRQVEAIVERERPAHTEYEVKPFWALFRVGGARVGFDTVLGEGSRFTALALGSGYLGESFLAESHPWNVADRTVVGRDSLESDAAQ